MFYFITSNKEKILQATEQLKTKGIQFAPRSLELKEIQSNSIQEITQDKAEKSFEILKQPVVTSDHGWSIKGLRGFPGPYMKFMNEWFTPQDFLNLTKDLTDKTITLTEVLCYKDDRTTKIFSAKIDGRLTNEIKGDHPPAMTITTFDGINTVAEYFKMGKDPLKNNSAWKEFSNWYISYIKEIQ